MARSDDCELLIEKIPYGVVRITHVAFERDGHWLPTLWRTEPHGDGVFADEGSPREVRVDSVLGEHLQASERENE